MSNDDSPTLKDVAQAALDRNAGKSGRELDRKAKLDGLTISYTTINHIAAGTYNSKPSKNTLEALAQLSGWDLEDVYKAARMPLPLTPLRDALPPDADLLNGNQRRVVLDSVRLFIAQNRELHRLRTELEKAGSDSGTSAQKTLSEVPDGDDTGGTVTSLNPPKSDDDSGGAARELPIASRKGKSVGRAKSEAQDEAEAGSQVDPNENDGGA